MSRTFTSKDALNKDEIKIQDEDYDEIVISHELTKP
jgi:hypothetical protein